MITRSKMRRQLYRGGGIASIRRQKYGFGDWVRKLIPNEIADIAVKAAPFVAPFNPGIAAAMRGIGRYDQRGSLSDAFKQAALTYGGGQLVRGIGGAGVQKDFFGTPGDRFTSPLSEGRTQSFKNLFKGRGEAQGRDIATGKQSTFDALEHDLLPGDSMITKGTTDKLSIQGIWDKFKSMPSEMQSAIVGGVSGSLAGIAQWFENQIPQEPGESMEEYMARRKVAVGKLMRQYMDNTRAYDPAWTTMTDQQKDETVAQYNMNQGGRVGYQTGGITMANTLAQNIAQNRANQQAVGGMFEAARSKLPGYVAPQRAMAPTPAPISPRLPPITLPVQPPERPDDVVEQPMPIEPDMPIGKFPIPPGGDVQPYVAPPVTDTMTPISELDKIREQVLREQENDPFEMRLREEERLRNEAVAPNIPMPLPGGPGGDGLGGMLPDFYEEVMPPLMPEQPAGTDRPYTAVMPDEGNKYVYDPDGTRRQVPLTPEEKYRIENPDETATLMPVEEVDRPPERVRGIEPIYNDPLPYDQLMAGFEEWKRNNPDKLGGAGTMAIVPATLPGGHKYDFRSGSHANQFRQYLESIGQAPYQGRTDENMIAKIGGGLSKLNQGGRVGLYAGGEPEAGIKSLDVGAPDITYEGNEGPQAPMKMASAQYYADMYSKYAQDMINSGVTPMSIEDFIKMIKEQEGNMSRGPVLPEDPTKPINPFAPKPTGPALPDKMMAAQGGRIGQMYGTGPQGLPGIPRMAPDGMEFDMRQNGGFQGLGAKEGKDDVPAMLAKNEFVFTADAVRGAGGGDIELGAQRMYDTMKNLERRMA